MKVCIVSSCGGHLTEVRQLKAVRENHTHFYVLNDQAQLPDDMQDMTFSSSTRRRHRYGRYLRRSR